MRFWRRQERQPALDRTARWEAVLARYRTRGSQMLTLKLHHHEVRERHAQEVKAAAAAAAVRAAPVKRSERASATGCPPPSATSSNPSDPLSDLTPPSPDAPDMDTRLALFLSDTASLEAGGYETFPPPPPAQPPRLVERELYVGAWAPDGQGGRVPFGPRRTVRVRVPDPEPEPPTRLLSPEGPAV